MFTNVIKNDGSFVPYGLSIDIACDKLLFAPVSGQLIGTLNGNEVAP